MKNCKSILQEVGQVAIAVSDLARSIKFYHQQLGLPLLFEVPSKMAFLQCGDVRLMLTILQGAEEDHNTSVIYYKVRDLNTAMKFLESNGVQFIQQPQFTAKMEDHELWQGFIRDPDNNLIGIMAELPLKESKSKISG